RRHTRSDRDWSSDVCSSDLPPARNTQWARNLRAVGECELRAGGRKSRFTAREIPAAERAPLVAAYVKRYGSKYGGFVAKEFAARSEERRVGKECRVGGVRSE